jgi:L-seryl-tRNA(Ser) seleniumtransferase
MTPGLDELRSLPSVHRLAESLDEEFHELAVGAAREAIEAARERIEGGQPAGDVEGAARERLAAKLRTGPVRVVNATGVVLHTNLGRASLAQDAVDAAVRASRNYSNLEYDLETGRRGSRQRHVEALLRELTGAEAALVVNNCAAAVLLAVATLASERQILISRGQLVEIGGSFRIPEIVAQSGARLIEVGTTNRTRLSDYERALGPDVGAILHVHPSNFRVLGFTEQSPLDELCGLGVPVIDDVGSGAMVEDFVELADEPLVAHSVASGAEVVCFSGDKLLGGPQAGVMVGRHAAISACAAHPLARAVRIDKLSLAALAATLCLYRDPRRAAMEVPVLRMLIAGRAELLVRAEAMREHVVQAGHHAHVVEASAKVGGGALPLTELTGPACAVDPGATGADELARRLRLGEPAVVGRTRDDLVLLDPRTLTDDEAAAAAKAVVAALR